MILQKNRSTPGIYTHKKEQKKKYQKFHRENIIHTGQIIFRTKKTKKNVYICISLMFFRRVVF